MVSVDTSYRQDTALGVSGGASVGRATIAAGIRLAPLVVVMGEDRTFVMGRGCPTGG